MKNLNNILTLIITIGIGLTYSSSDTLQKNIPSNLQLRFENARELRRSGHLGAAIDSLNSILKVKNDYYLAQYNKALALADLYLKDTTEESIAKIKKEFDSTVSISRKLSITDPSVYISEGWFLMTRQKFADAEEAFTIAESQKDKLSEKSLTKLYNNFGLLYLQMGKLKEAREKLTIASEQFNSKLAKDKIDMLNAIDDGKSK